MEKLINIRMVQSLLAIRQEYQSNVHHPQSNILDPSLSFLTVRYPSQIRRLPAALPVKFTCPSQIRRLPAALPTKPYHEPRSMRDFPNGPKGDVNEGVEEMVKEWVEIRVE